jgi:hypothetical protein
MVPFVTSASRALFIGLAPVVARAPPIVGFVTATFFADFDGAALAAVNDPTATDAITAATIADDFLLSFIFFLSLVCTCLLLVI